MSAALNICYIGNGATFGPNPDAKMIEKSLDYIGVYINLRSLTQDKPWYADMLPPNSVAMFPLEENVDLYALARRINKAYPDQQLYIHNLDGQHEEAIVAFALRELRTHLDDYSEIKDPLLWLKLNSFFMVCEEPEEAALLKETWAKAKEAAQKAQFWKKNGF